LLDSTDLIDPDVKHGQYKLKRVAYQSKQVTIMLQNENGPCPLIAISNILALKGAIVIEGKNHRASVKDVVEKITEYIKKQHPTSTEEENKEIEDVEKSLPDLQIGLDVNFGFLSCDSFESSKKSKIFDILKIKMLHGWLVDPNLKAAEIIGSSTYNDITLQLVSLDEPTNTNMPSSPPKAISTPKKEERKYTKEEGTIVEEFLSLSSAQLTDYGLKNCRLLYLRMNWWCYSETIISPHSQNTTELCII